MCGILACISRNGKRIDPDAFHQAGRKMGHRGPDAQGSYLTDWIGIFHNRLSIINLSEHGRIYI